MGVVLEGCFKDGVTLPRCELFWCSGQCATSKGRGALVVVVTINDGRIGKRDALAMDESHGMDRPMSLLGGEVMAGISTLVTCYPSEKGLVRCWGDSPSMR